MKKHKPDIALIRKYLNGELSPREMYELERQAQDDPMLMDVIMGMELGDASIHSTNLSEIRQQLQQRTQRGNTKRMIAWRPWAVAASIVFVLALGGLWILREEPLENHIAQQAAKPYEKAPEARNEAVDEVTVTPSPQQPTISDSPRTAVLLSSTPTTRLTAQDSADPASDAQITRLAALADTEETNKYDDILDSAARVPLLAFQQSGNQLAAKSVVSRQETITEPVAQTLSGRVAGVSVSARPQRTDTGQVADKQVLNEIVVANGVQRKKAVSSMKPTPMVGWEHYNQYLREHARAGNSKKGTVTLAFTVDDVGNPTDIRLVKGLTDTLNEKAVQLVRDGSKWQQGRDAAKEVTLKIRFR